MEALLARVNELYDLKLHSHEKVLRGSLSENYILSDGKTKYFLKKYRFENKERIEEVHAVKKYFADGGIPVILPIVSEEKNTFFLFDGRYFALFPFIGDRHMERGSLTDEAIRSLGEMLGQIHLLGKKAKLPIKENFKMYDVEKVLRKIASIQFVINTKSVLNDFDRLTLNILEKKEHLIHSNKVAGTDIHLPNDHLIHGDYLDHNVFFNKADKVSYVFDFEKADYSPRMHEVFRSLVYSFLSDDFSPRNVDRAKLYLDSYRKIYPTPKEELMLGLKLFYLKSIHTVWIEGEHYLKNNHRADDFLSGEFQRLKHLSEHFQEFADQMI